MTADEKNAIKLELAAAIFAGMYHNARPVLRASQEERDAMSPDALAVLVDAEHKAARDEYRHAAQRAELAFTAAGAFIAEAELHTGPVDDEGNELDARALNPKCAHGNPFSEPCPHCEADTGNAGQGGTDIATPPAT